MVRSSTESKISASERFNSQ